MESAHPSLSRPLFAVPTSVETRVQQWSHGSCEHGATPVVDTLARPSHASDASHRCPCEFCGRGLFLRSVTLVMLPPLKHKPLHGSPQRRPWNDDHRAQIKKIRTKLLLSCGRVSLTVQTAPLHHQKPVLWSAPGHHTAAPLCKHFAPCWHLPWTQVLQCSTWTECLVLLVLGKCGHELHSLCSLQHLDEVFCAKASKPAHNTQWSHREASSSCFPDLHTSLTRNANTGHLAFRLAKNEWFDFMCPSYKTTQKNWHNLLHWALLNGAPTTLPPVSPLFLYCCLWWTITIASSRRCSWS